MAALAGILAACFSAFMFALKDVKSKGAIEKAGLWGSVFYIHFLSWLPVAAYFALAGGHAFSNAELYAGAIVGLGVAVGMVFYFKALEAGSVGLSGSVAISWVLFTAIAAFVFLGERLGALQILGSAVAFFGIFYMNIGERAQRKSITYALLAAVIWGLSWFMVKPLVDSAGIVPTYFLTVGFESAGLFILALLFGGIGKPMASALLPAGLQVIGYLVETYGIMVSAVSLVSIIYSPAYIFFVLLLTRAFLGERLERRHYAGIALILLGIAAITAG